MYRNLVDSILDFPSLFLGIFIEMKTNRDFLAMHPMIRDKLFISLFLSFCLTLLLGIFCEVCIGLRHEIN